MISKILSIGCAALILLSAYLLSENKSLRQKELDNASAIAALTSSMQEVNNETALCNSNLKRLASQSAASQKSSKEELSRALERAKKNYTAAIDIVSAKPTIISEVSLAECSEIGSLLKYYLIKYKDAQ